MGTNTHGMLTEHGVKPEDQLRIHFVMEQIQIETLMYLGEPLVAVPSHAHHFIMVIMSFQK